MPENEHSSHKHPNNGREEDNAATQTSSQDRVEEKISSPMSSLLPSAASVIQSILDAPDPADLVPRIAEEDLYWLVLEADPESSLELLSLASEEQWQYLVDLTSWKSDGLDRDTLGTWMERLLEADAPRFVSWLIQEQPVLLLLFLSGKVRVIEDPEQLEGLDPAEYFTLDDVFFIHCPDEDLRRKVKGLLEHISDTDFKRYQSLMLSVNRILPAEAEETLRRFRDARLADRGFVPWEEAMLLFTRTTPETLPVRLAYVGDPEEEESPPKTPLTPVLFMGSENAFAAVMAALDDAELKDRLGIEFASVCNHLMCAEHRVPESGDDLRNLYRKAAGLIGIGIERTDPGGTAEYRRAVERHTLHDLFRLGFTTLQDVQWKGKRWWKGSWIRSRGFDLSFWDTPWEETLAGLFRKHPKRYDPASTEDPPLADFETLAQIHAVDSLLDTLKAVDELLAGCAGPRFSPDKEGSHPLTCHRCLYTLWARCSLELPADLLPLTREDLARFFDRMAEAGKDKETWAGDAVIRTFVEILKKRIPGIEEAEWERIRNVYADLLSRAWEEFAGIEARHLDPRYVDIFWVSEGKSEDTAT